MKRILVSIYCIACFALASVAQLNTDRLMSVGRNALYFEDYVLSIQYFSQVVRVKPQLVEPYFYRAIAKIQLEDYVGAQSDLDVVIERNPFIPMAYYARGFALARQQQWLDAATDFTLALQFSPDNVTYIINRIEAFRRGGRYADALADIDLLTQRFPAESDFFFEKGITQIESGDTLGAYDTFGHVAELDSNSAYAWSALGTVALMLDNDTIALNALDRAIALDDNNLNTRINRGILHYRRHNYRMAVSDYDRAVDIDSTAVDAIFNRALLRNEIGDYNGAIDDLTRILKLKPAAYDALYQRAIVYTTLGYLDLAIADYTKLIDRYPHFVPALYARADIYEKQGYAEKAFIDRDNAFNIAQDYKNNKNAKADSVMVDVRVQNVDSQSAIKDLVKAFDTNPNDMRDDRYSGSRGLVQNRTTELRQEPNIELSLNRPQSDGLPIALYNPRELQRLNESVASTAPLYLVAQNRPLTATMVNHHFSTINQLSEAIDGSADDVDIYLIRAIHYATIQDFDNTVADLSRVILLDPDNAMAFFCRANVRYRQLEATAGDILEMNKPGASDSSDPTLIAPLRGTPNRHMVNNQNIYELIMRDYDYVIASAPDFAFAWYNRANMLAMQHDYRTAIDNYTKAIGLEPRLAEAYFNRGLAYLLSSDLKLAARDLSKAGELGLYRAYSLLKYIQARQ